MNSRQRKAQLKQTVADCITYRKTYQNQPFTCVHLEAEICGKFYVADGFSKVRWPDKWDAEYGERMATDKAMMDIVRELIAEQDSLQEALEMSAIKE